MAWEFDISKGFNEGFNYTEFRENAMKLGRNSGASPDGVTAPAAEVLLNNDDLGLVHAAARNSSLCARFRLENPDLFNLFVIRTQDWLARTMDVPRIEIESSDFPDRVRSADQADVRVTLGIISAIDAHRRGLAEQA